MKKVYGLLVGALVVFSLHASVWAAGADIGLQHTNCVDSICANAIPGETFVQGISIFAPSATSVCAFYDSTSVSSAIQDSALVDEIGEAVAGAGNTRYYPNPIFFSNGVTIEPLGEDVVCTAIH